jgi:hypothetical protein
MAQNQTPDTHTLEGDSLRDTVQLHLLRNIGEAAAAFTDADAWSGKSKEAGPPVDVLVCPPEGERRFAYVSSFGCSMRTLQAPAYVENGRKRRTEFVMAAPQRGDEAADRQMLNMAANTVRQFAKLVHLQPITVELGETVAFSDDPTPVFENTDLVAFAFMAPRIPADGFARMTLRPDEAVDFIAPVPIRREELALARQKGPAALNRALLDGGITEMLDLARGPVPAARTPSRRGLFGWVRSLFGQG